jgi:hypothetical protein
LAKPKHEYIREICQLWRHHIEANKNIYGRTKFNFFKNKIALFALKSINKDCWQNVKWVGRFLIINVWFSVTGATLCNCDVIHCYAKYRNRFVAIATYEGNVSFLINKEQSKDSSYFFVTNIALKKLFLKNQKNDIIVMGKKSLTLIALATSVFLKLRCF